MGGLVEEAIRGALEALVDHDAEAALAVIIGDRADQRDAARHLDAHHDDHRDPVAGRPRPALPARPRPRDVRARADGRPCRHRSRSRPASSRPQPPLAGYVDLPEMARLVARLVHGILRALVDVDEGAARLVAAGDDEVDALYHRTFDQVLDLMRADPDNVDRGARILFAAHYLERIGDRVTNIAEDVVFLATGEIEDLNP